jgi:hypothetical protein
MEAILKFNLPDEQQEYDRFNKADDMANMLWEVLLNDKKKFIRQLEADKKTTEREFDLIDSIWNHLWERADENDVDIERLFG